MSNPNGFPKLEARITVPTGGWSVQAFAGGSTSTITIPAADYYWTSAGSGTASLVAMFEQQLQSPAGTFSTFAVDQDYSTDVPVVGFAGTGRVTVECDGTWAITWTSTALRDVCGYTGNIVPGQGSSTSTECAEYYWAPGTKRSDPLCPDGDAGYPYSDGTLTVAPSGKSKALEYNVLYRDHLEFRYVLGRYVWDSVETYQNESWEYFWKQCIATGLPVRYHPNRETLSTYVTYRVTSNNDIGVRSMNGVYGASGLWSVTSPVIQLV